MPAGAVPKDGPSAGVAMTVALSSLISGRPVRNDVAMTGEVTLTGQVLPIGGLKEKSLAAQRAGIKRVIVPARNEGDVAEIPEHERRAHSMPGLRRADDHRPARRRDEGVGAGSPHLCPRPLREMRPSSTTTVLKERRPHPRPRRRGPEGRALGRGDDVLALCCCSRPAGPGRRGDDRGSDPSPAGSCRSVSSGEGRCGAPGRDQAGDPPDRNEADLEIPEAERSELEFVYVDEVSEAIDAALASK